MLLMEEYQQKCLSSDWDLLLLIGDCKSELSMRHCWDLYMWTSSEGKQLTNLWFSEISFV